MPTFDFTSPEGKTYSIDGPDGATKEQAFQMLQMHLGNTKPMQLTQQPVQQPQLSPLDTIRAERQTLMDRGLQSGFNIGGGLVRGAGSIGATFMRALPNALGGDTALENEQRRSAMDAGLQNLIGADPKSIGYQAGKLGGEIAGTAGIGSGLAAGAGILKGGVALQTALRTGGLSTGAALPTTATLGAKAADIALRTGAGAIVGGSSAAAVGDNPLVGGAVGGMFPLAVKVAGAVGGALGSGMAKLKGAFAGNASEAVAVLSKAMGGLSEAELMALKNAAAQSPNELVPGSKLTLAQALQYVGKGDPNINFLERVVSQGPGGGKLLQRYADQNTARLDALKSQGAQLYEGAAKTEAHEAGNLLGGVIRTQGDDASAALRSQWEALNKQAIEEGTALQLPLDAMRKTMAPFSRGSFTPPRYADKALAEGEKIGTETIPGYTTPAVKPLPAKGNSTQTLEQAVRSAGGIKSSGLLTGELSDLGNKQAKTSGLLNSKSGQPMDLLAEKMHERGFIPDSDPATLLSALRNGGGKKVYASDANDGAFQRMADAAMGDMPVAQVVPPQVLNKAAPYAEFQRLRSDAGQSAANLASKNPSDKEIGVLNQIEKLLAGRVDDAASGNLLSGEAMTDKFRQAYIAAREATKQNHGIYNADKIKKITEKKYGGDYNLNGDEIFNQLWHGAGGLSGDVNALKNVIAQGNNEPALDKFRQAIMSEAASKTTAANNLESAFPKYVNSRIVGIDDIMRPEQANALRAVSADISNAAKAQTVKGMTGSDTAAKISKAVDSGLLDAPAAKAIANMANYKAPGIGLVRNFFADLAMRSKGNKLADLLADPRYMENAIGDYMKSSPAQTKKFLATPEGNKLLQLLQKTAPVAIAQ